MNELTFDYVDSTVDVTITVFIETGRSTINGWIVQNKLGMTNDTGQFVLPFDQHYQRQKFTEALTRSKVDGNLGFEWPHVTDDENKLCEALENWLDLPAKLVERWCVKLNDVNQPPNDKDLLPPELVPEKKEETPT